MQRWAWCRHTYGLGFISVSHICTWAVHLCSPARQWGEMHSARTQLSHPKVQNTAVKTHSEFILLCLDCEGGDSSLCGSSKAEETGLPECLSWRLRAVRGKCHSVLSWLWCHFLRVPSWLLWVTRLRACWTFGFIWTICTAVGQSW